MPTPVSRLGRLSAWTTCVALSGDRALWEDTGPSAWPAVHGAVVLGVSRSRAQTAPAELQVGPSPDLRPSAHVFEPTAGKGHRHVSSMRKASQGDIETCQLETEVSSTQVNSRPDKNCGGINAADSPKAYVPEGRGEPAPRPAHAVAKPIVSYEGVLCAFCLCCVEPDLLKEEAATELTVLDSERSPRPAAEDLSPYAGSLGNFALRSAGDCSDALAAQETTAMFECIEPRVAVPFEAKHLQGRNPRIPRASACQAS